MIKLIITLLLMFASNAFAAAPIYYWLGGASDFPGQKFASPDAFCTALVARYNAANPQYTNKASCRPPHSDAWVNYFSPTQGNTDYRVYKTAGCADGSAPDTSKALALQCPDTPPPETCLPSETITRNTYVVTKAGKDVYDPFAKVPGAQNGMGCKVEVIDIVDCYSLPKSADPGTIYCTFTTKQTGGTANPSPSPVTPGQEEKTRENSPPVTGKDDGTCPKGSVNVGLSASGIPMCVGQGTAPANAPAAPPKVETEKNEPTADGGTKNTKTETVTNADGSKTTTTTVTVTGPTGEKSTTQDKTTGNNSSGGAGRETKDDKGDLCKQNPLLNVCKNSTVAGKCSEIVCTGDAIQCATLRAAADLQCKAQKDEEALKASPLAAKGQAAIDGKDLEGLPGPKNGQVVNVGAMKAEGWLGNGAAFEDVSVSLRGQEILIPLSKWSSYLLPFRYMLMIIASLISYRVLAGAILRE